MENTEFFDEVTVLIVLLSGLQKGSETKLPLLFLDNFCTFQLLHQPRRGFANIEILTGFQDGEIDMLASRTWFVHSAWLELNAQRLLRGVADFMLFLFAEKSANLRRGV